MVSVTTAPVTSETLAEAKQAVEDAKHALREAELDTAPVSVANVDQHLNRIDQLSTTFRRAEAKVRRIQTLLDIQTKAQQDRDAKEAELRPEINSRASKLTRSGSHLTEYASQARAALQRLIEASEAHDSGVIGALMALDMAGLRIPDGADCDSGSLPSGQGVKLAGQLFTRTPGWAAAIAVFTSALEVLPFSHPIRREFDLHKRLEVRGIEDSGILDYKAPAKKETK